MPDGEFIYPWQVWEDHRERLGDFGHGEAKGLWFLRVNLARDFLALTKHEVSDWDSWRDQTTGDKRETEEAVAQCTALAAAAREISLDTYVSLEKYGTVLATLTTPHWHA